MKTTLYIISIILAFSFQNAFANNSTDIDVDSAFNALMKKVDNISENNIKVATPTTGKKVTSICGVDFGSTKEAAEKILKSKYGEPVDNQPNEITYGEIDYAGLHFAIINFDFQSDGNRTYLFRVSFMAGFKTKSEAQHFQKQLYEKMASKYFIIYENDMFTGGIAPTWDDNKPVTLDTTVEDYIGFSCCLQEVDNSYLRASGTNYSLLLRYGPYNYINEEF